MVSTHHEETPPMPPLSLPALQSGKPTAWEEAIYAFLVEKRSRSGSTRTVESYARMLWPFFRVRTPDQVRSADVLAYAPVSYTHLRAHETRHDLVCRLL